MAVWKKLPMGIEQFEEIRRDGYYYVDKTGLIRVLMENGGKSEPLYPAKAVWKVAEYEYAAFFF